MKTVEKLWRNIFWFLNTLATPFVIRSKFGKNLKFVGDKLPKAPFVMVSNHANFFDPWIVCHANPKPFSIMMNEEGFKTGSFTQWYLKNIGAFPKKKGMSDIGAMKKSIADVRAGYSLMVFPEGQTSWEGETQPIFLGIEKLVQKLKTPLVICRIEGNFLARPWWADFARKGQITVHRQVLTPETLTDKTPNEIRNKIISFIKHNDIEASVNNHFKGDNLCSGMQNLLWLCPSCKSSETLELSGNSVVCSNCKKEHKFNANLYLTPAEGEAKNLYEWVKLQKEFVREKIASSQEDEVICLSEKVSLIQNDNNGRITTLDIGKLQITKEKLNFIGDSANIEVAIKDVVAPVFQLKNILHFDSDKGELKFMFPSTCMMKPLTFLRELDNWAEAEKRGYYA